MVSAETRQFIEQHINDDPALLRLKTKGTKDVDLLFAVGQIAIRHRLKEKLPDWSANFGLLFPSRLSAEQCSSQLTAHYKQRFVSNEFLMDMTGGLGIDFYHLFQKAGQGVYIDQKEENCKIARFNFSVLGLERAQVIHGDSLSVLAEWKAPVDFIYIDPSRRDGYDKRVYALQGCEPDVVKHKAFLLQRAARVLIKVSPMADIKQLLALFPEAKEVHIVSVRNECKEVLLLLGRKEAGEEPAIHCVNLTSEKTEEFVFSFAEEERSAISYGPVASYLYEPDASVLKGGAFKSVAVRYGVNKLSRHSHLYTSGKLIEEFPGRIFEIENLFLFDKKGRRELISLFRQANISARNFPLSVADIRRQTGIGEGGSAYLFATTLQNGEKVIIQSKKVLLSDQKDLLQYSDVEK